VYSAVVLAGVLATGRADAEKSLFKNDEWEVYTDGRAAGFLSYAHGNGFPLNTLDANGNVLHDVKGGGWLAVSARDSNTDQGTIDMMRVRSGMLANQLGLGVRYQISPTVKATAYIQIWAFIESIGRMKNQPNYADVRQGYAKIEGPWGSFLAGRTRSLFSRGATDIDVLYAHRWGVGFPAAIDSSGPTQGQIGFGVLGSGFAAGLIYATPVLAGFQLSAGVFDPIQLQGNGSWFRTKFLRPEGELTFEQPLGVAGKIVLFVNGAIQDVYQDGYCPPTSTPNGPGCSVTAAGVGFGGRFEYGPVHLGVASHRGNGLGLNYALEVSDSSTDPLGNLRASDGYYVQSQFVLGKFDLFAGWGITRIFLTAADNQNISMPAAGDNPHSVIKYQMGYNGGVVFNYTPNLHFDLDYFRAQAAWYLGEHQNIDNFNGGMTFNW
jgi:hypothetical protein